jgi:hypothetical protein
MGTKEQIEWRKNKVMEYMAHGFNNQSEIARVMELPLSTINRDYLNLKQEAKQNMAKFTETFAWEFEKSLVEINSIQKEAWLTAKVSKYERNKILALGLAKDCLQFKVDLISNADIISKTSNFIEIKKKKLQKMMEDEEQEEIDEAVITEALALPTPTDSPIITEESQVTESQEVTNS